MFKQEQHDFNHFLKKKKHDFNHVVHSRGRTIVPPSNLTSQPTWKLSPSALEQKCDSSESVVHVHFLVFF
jgi:hypothetical protein